jgi:hypothetical protein
MKTVTLPLSEFFQKMGLRSPYLFSILFLDPADSNSEFLKFHASRERVAESEDMYSCFNNYLGWRKI